MDTIESELRGLLDGGVFNRNKLMLMLKEIQSETEKRAKHTRTPEKKYQPPATRYTEIRRNYTCRHCGAQFSSVVKLLPKESVPVIGKHGEPIIITADSPCEIDCYVGSCVKCAEFVRTLERDDLEQRYVALVSKYAIYTHQEHRPGKPEEVRL